VVVLRLDGLLLVLALPRAGEHLLCQGSQNCLEVRELGAGDVALQQRQQVGASVGTRVVLPAGLNDCF